MWSSPLRKETWNAGSLFQAKPAAWRDAAEDMSCHDVVAVQDCRATQAEYWATARQWERDFHIGFSRDVEGGWGGMRAQRAVFTEVVRGCVQRTELTGDGDSKLRV